jgi:hypothetical protein
MTSNLLRGMKGDGDSLLPNTLIEAKAYFGTADLFHELCTYGHSHKAMRSFTDGSVACLECAKWAFSALSKGKISQLFFLRMCGEMTPFFFKQTERLARIQDSRFPEFVGKPTSRRFSYLAVIFFFRQNKDDGREKFSLGVLFDFISRATLLRGEEEKEVIKNFFDIP